MTFQVCNESKLGMPAQRKCASSKCVNCTAPNMRRLPVSRHNIKCNMLS